MDKVIATALLIIAAVVGVGLVVNAALPAISRSSGAVLGGADKVDDRIKTQISIVHDTYDSANDDVIIWVKNVGASRISAIENSDLFFGQEASFARITQGAGVGEWSYAVEGGGEWLPESTVKFTINYDGAPAAGTYFFKIVTPNGVSDEGYLSIA